MNPALKKELWTAQGNPISNLIRKLTKPIKQSSETIDDQVESNIAGRLVRNTDGIFSDVVDAA